MDNKTGKLIPENDKNLYFDIGNSAIKISYLEQGKWTEPSVFAHNEISGLLQWLSDVRDEFDRFIVASVVQKTAKALLGGLGQGKNIQIRTDDIPEAFTDYESIDTLGVDRLLAAIGAWSRREEPCVVIDGGTACTIDYIDERGVFRGGAILPGLTMLEQAVEQYTPALPRVERKIPDRWPGKSTESCLQWGIAGGFVDAVKTALSRYDGMGEFNILLTGGDVNILKQYIDREMTEDQKLVFRGMHYVYSLITSSGQSEQS